MKRRFAKGLAVLAVLSVGLSACGGDDPSATPSASGPQTLTLAGWTLTSGPEFKALADAFHAANPSVTVELKEYSAGNDYDTQMTADLAAGKAPDVYVLKNLKNFLTYQNGKQLLDVTEVASSLGGKVQGLPSYAVDGKTYAIPYRSDSWYLYYNKDLFTAAGVAAPDGSWTWDDYAAAAEKLTAGLKAKGKDAVGIYQHTWQSLVQGFALAQTPGASIQNGDFSYLAPYYQRSLRLQANHAQASFGTATTNKLTYQSQFGKQKAAMMLMGSWYVATLLNQQAKGDADTFAFGLAPAPQRDASTVKTPVTFGDPTAMGINPKIDKSRVATAKSFLRFVASEEGAKVLAGVGITPAHTSDAVTSTYFAVKGVPSDELSRFTFTTHDTKPENPVAKSTATLQNILNDAHTAVMSGSTPLDKALAEAQARAKSEVPAP
jgi:multiple sugar transport system substrate-binding protein